MKLFFATMLALVISVGLMPIPTQAVMVDFESSVYTAGSTFDGVDGWQNFSGIIESAVVTPDYASGDDTVLAGSQSGRMAGYTIMCRQFDTDGVTRFGTGSIVSTHMQLNDVFGARGSFCYSHNPYGGSTPAGIIANVGGTFQLFGDTEGYYLDTGVVTIPNADYLLEMELDLENQSFNAYATNITFESPRTFLGSLPFLLAKITPNMYPTSGVVLITGSGTVGIFDDLDVLVVPPAPLLPEPVDFEADVYVPGNSVDGIDGWQFAIGAGTNQIVSTSALSGNKSLQMADSGESYYALQRNFGEGTTYDDGSIISVKMMASDIAGSRGEIYFSNNQSALLTPGGIAGAVGGEFSIFGVDATLTNTVFCEADTEYLLEMQLNLKDQTFASYVTNLTDNGPRTLLGSAGFYNLIEPGDESNSGYVLITRGGAEVLFDDLNCVAASKPNIPGDANGDGKVDGSDVTILAGNWQTLTGATWGMGDFNGDGKVDGSDVTILAGNWQAGVSATASAVPEPSTLTAFFVGLLLVVLVRRKKA